MDSVAARDAERAATDTRDCAVAVVWLVFQFYFQMVTLILELAFSLIKATVSLIKATVKVKVSVVWKSGVIWSCSCWRKCTARPDGRSKGMKWGTGVRDWGKAVISKAETCSDVAASCRPFGGRLVASLNVRLLSCERISMGHEWCGDSICVKGVALHIRQFYCSFFSIIASKFAFIYVFISASLCNPCVIHL